MNKNEVMNLVGDFTWSYNNEFFIETKEGNFIWKDPDYPGGTNVISVFNGDYKKWCKSQGIPFGRSKGKHVISDYCGTEFEFSK